MFDIFAAIVIDWIIGDPYWFPHPVIYMGKLIRFLENRFRRACRTPSALRAAGGVIVLAVALVSFLVPYGLLQLTKGIAWLHHLVNIFMIWTTLAARCLHVEGKKVYDSLERNDIEDARVKLSYIVGRETSRLSEDEIIRADVETIAENTSDGVIAPLLYAFIGGAPLAMLYKGINTMDSMLGYMSEKYRHIGFFPAKTDDAANLIPARLTGILMCLAAPLTGGSILKSLSIMIRDRKNHKSPNCGYPEAAAAGAMGVQLGGTNVYFGEEVYKPTIGEKTVKLSKEHITGAVRLMYAAEILLALLAAAAAFAVSL